MSARILIVDDVETNRHLLQARLVAEYYDVETSANGVEALRSVYNTPPDLILLDVMMPEMDGYETCRQLKKDNLTRYIPVVMITSLKSQSERLKGLEAGADDFLTKPVDKTVLMARVRSLLRLKMVMDEWLVREAEARSAGFLDEENFFVRDKKEHFVLITDNKSIGTTFTTSLGAKHHIISEGNPDKALAYARDGTIDMVMLDLTAKTFDALRLCARLRSQEATRSIPILALADPDDKRRMARALDLGVNDLLCQPFDHHELIARVKTQMRYKSFAQYLRVRFHESLEMSVRDPLTRLYNRLYLDRKLPALLNNIEEQPLCIFIVDIDHFKNINDTYGHDTGDLVLKEVAQRISKNVRALDMVCRLGGEEFLVIMPDTSHKEALITAERLRQHIDDHPFLIKAQEKHVHISISLGVAQARKDDKKGSLIKRADQALYHAKHSGRNRVASEKDIQAS